MKRRTFAIFHFIFFVQRNTIELCRVGDQLFYYPRYDGGSELTLTLNTTLLLLLCTLHLQQGTVDNHQFTRQIPVKIDQLGGFASRLLVHRCMVQREVRGEGVQLFLVQLHKCPDNRFTLRFP